MTITKEAFVDLQEKYAKVIKLIEEDSKFDPENEPYLSKYSARQILIGMKANIENLLRNQSQEDQQLKLTAMLAAVQLHLGTLSIDTDETSTGEKHLEKCKEAVEQYALKPEMILITLNMYNQLGILWAQREPAEQAKIYLEQAESLYTTYKILNVPPIDISELFQVNVETYNVELAQRNYEKTYTLTLYYLAQLYGSMKDALKSSVYCHITLQRQLEMKDYEPIDWALNAATLSQFFMEKSGFKQARHHLAASLYVLDIYKKELDAITEMNEAYDAKIEVFKHRSADVARCWVKYGLLLLSKSKERLLNHTDDINTNCSISSDLAKLELSNDSTVSSHDLQNLDFKGIDVSNYENEVTDQFVLTLEDARKVFHNIKYWSNKAQEYYTLENLASDYIEIVLDQSQMYKNLLFFDDSQENQAKLHKRRVDLLENVLNNINPKYYLQYCQQIWYELGRIYTDILDIKMEKLRESDERPKPQALNKINNLIEKSIKHYKSFIDSIREWPSKELPSKLPADTELAVLQAHEYIAAHYGRFISLDKRVQLKNTELSLEFYQYVCDYCERNPKAKELTTVEYGICKSMVNLLPIKIAKLKQETAS